MRTPEQINADYSSLALELGDIEAKASKLMARKQQLLQRVPMLDEEMTKSTQAIQQQQAIAAEQAKAAAAKASAEGQAPVLTEVK